MKLPSVKRKTLEWFARIVVAVVFAMNVQCALEFIVDPANYVASYQLDGPIGNAVVQGMGVTFLMWNATYPLVIWQPSRYCTLFGIVLAQQAIGLVGESYILATLPIGCETLAAGVQRFFAFDAFGLITMSAAFAALACKKRCFSNR